MLLKSADSQDQKIQQLEALLAATPGPDGHRIKRDLEILKAGERGERDAAYFLNFHWERSDRHVLLHDLRLKVGGRVAQIDHLLINPRLDCFVFESKHFHAGVKITEEGEFLRWNAYKKTFEGMPSPLAQNDRHIAVHRDAFEKLEMPTRLGIRLMPTYFSYVLVSANARIDRPKGFDTSRVIKVDDVMRVLDKQIDEESPLTTALTLGKIVDKSTLKDIGRQLAKLHRPATAPLAPPRIETTMPVIQPEKTPTTNTPAPTAKPEGPICKHCGLGSGTILYGKYGYYLKCASCDGNTSIRAECGVEGHQARIRKDGPKFYRECAGCGLSVPYFKNAE